MNTNNNKFGDFTTAINDISGKIASLKKDLEILDIVKFGTGCGREMLANEELETEINVCDRKVTIDVFDNDVKIAGIKFTVTKCDLEDSNDINISDLDIISIPLDTRDIKRLEGFLELIKGLEGVVDEIWF